MAWTTALAIYFLIWWVTFFAVLPFGVRPQGGDGEIVPGTDPGAPMLHALGSKLLWTTLVSGVIWGICYLVYTRGWLTLADVTGAFGWK